MKRKTAASFPSQAGLPGVLLMLLLGCCSTPSLSMPATQADTESSQALDAPRLMRYVSQHQETRGEVCYGLVVEKADGVPSRVLPLSYIDPALCSPQKGGNAATRVEIIRRALAAAETAWLAHKAGETPPVKPESLDEKELAHRVKPPVSITQEQFDAEQSFVVGAGLNYRLHQEEVDIGEELLLFPKPVPPSGAYEPVSTGIQIGAQPPKPVLLLDYEVELALVLLEDVDLAKPLPDYDEFMEQVAFFSANDLSNRKPIILDPESGYARGKSHPGYLPLGPWMIHGRHLHPKTANAGRDALVLSLTVTDDQQTRTLQRSRSVNMIRGPRAILESLAQRHRQGDRICMRDADGRPRYLFDSRGIVPAGSILLTGTPGGTAIQAPGFIERLELFFSGGFSVDGAKRRFAENSEGKVHLSNYLEPGDQVETWVQTLGRQRWKVVAETDLKPYGKPLPAGCD